MAHRPPLVWRFWIYSATAYLMPVVVQIAFPIDTSSMDELVWLVTLVPAFILSLHYGLRGAFVALLLGTALLVTVQLVLAAYYTTDDPRVTVPIYIAYGTLAISVGWLSEQLHEHYERSLELQAKQKTDGLRRLAAGLGHEFNNILTAMLANAELIASDDSGSAGEDGDELDRIKTVATKGAGIVRKLLGLSRHGLLEPKPLDLPSVVRELRPGLERLVPDAVDLEVRTDEDLPPISADREALEEILVNLVTNARDAMPLGGTLRIETATGTLTHEQFERRGWGDPGEYVCLSVADTGIGMNERSVQRVFEPFFTTKEPDEGTGLGMALVYGLVKQHRGFVDVESAPREGTEVTVYFRLTRERAEPSPDRAGRAQEGSETILVVEDEEAIRRAARTVLERSGYTVEVAADGQEALTVYDRLQDDISLVLCDVVMPELTGPEVHRALQAYPAPPKFLFTSGYPSDDLEHRVSLDPTLPFLAKPWDVEDLISAVRDVLEEGAAQIRTGR